MADEKLKYIVELLTQGDTTKAVNELNKLNAAGAKTSQGMMDIGRQFKTAFAAIAGSALINQSIEAFLEQERAVAKLNAALKSLGEFTPELSDEMQKLAESLSQVSLYADEAILNVIAKLTAAGAKRQDIERLTRAVLDLSTLMDRDLNRATQAFSQALSGEVTALKQAGIALDETKTATEQFNSALEQIEKKAGGQASEAVKTLGGHFEQLKKNVGEVKEVFGGIIVEALDPTIVKLNEIAKLLSSFGGANRSSIAGGLRSANKISGLVMGFGWPGLIQDFIGGKTPGPPMADLGPEAMATLQSFFSPMDLGAFPAGHARPQVTTAGLSAKDELAMDEQLARLAENVAKHAKERAEYEKDTQKSLEKQAGEIYEDLIAQNKQLTEEQKFQLQLQELKMATMQEFAGGLSHAIVSAFEEGDKAFQKFAQNFMRAVAEMILQLLIMRALTSVFGGATAAAGGGQFPSRFAGGGTAEVNSPTFFPRFNVIAGEAGREVMTVLSRPRFERINGVPAQVGMANGQRLAITNADALSRAGGGDGAGGRIKIQIGLAPEVKAEIVENSVKGAMVQFVSDMQDNTDVSRAVRKATA